MPLPEQFVEIADRVRNWGRWGDDDRLGTLNLLTPEAIVRGRDCIQHGRAISLAVPLKLDGVQVGAVPGRVNPLKTMVAINHSSMGDADGFHTSDDIVTMGLQSGTHWDGLAHVSYGGKLYNGLPADSIDEWGSAELGIHHVKSICGRGVLLDVARQKGVDMLESAYAISGADLDAAAEMGNVEIHPGDIVLIRTGRMRAYHEGGGMPYLIGPDSDGGNPGPSLDTVGWFHEHDIAAVANDTLTFEVFPSELPEAMLGIHMLHVVDMGLTQGQNFDLEALSEDCAADGVYEFFLAANPEPFVGGCGAPTNPVAIK